MSQYEFTPEQNSVIRAVALRCVVQAVLFAILGAITIVIWFATKSGLSGYMSFVSIFAALLLIAMSIVFYRPADNLRRITTTSGNDITELMTAMKEFNMGFNLLNILMVINLALVIAAVVFNIS